MNIGQILNYSIIGLLILLLHTSALWGIVYLKMIARIGKRKVIGQSVIVVNTITDEIIPDEHYTFFDKIISFSGVLPIFLITPIGFIGLITCILATVIIPFHMIHLNRLPHK